VLLDEPHGLLRVGSSSWAKTSSSDSLTSMSAPTGFGSSFETATQFADRSIGSSPRQAWRSCGHRRQVSGLLGHPVACWVLGHAEEVDLRVFSSITNRT
jgi:hypothetical protein